MALFKISKGEESNLPQSTVEGFAYFAKDTGNFFIDIETNSFNSHDEALAAGARIQVNANIANFAENTGFAQALKGDFDGKTIEIDVQGLLDGMAYGKGNSGEQLITGADGNPTWANFFVKGTQTAATNKWTGNLPKGVTAYYEGLTIDYQLPFAGTSTAATLQLGNLAATSVRRLGNSTVTTTFPAGAVIRLTYTTHSSVNSGKGAWEVSAYTDTNTALRLYRYTTGYNADTYPILVSRTPITGTIGTVGTNGSYSSVYGIISDDTTKTPVVNPMTGKMTVPGGIDSVVTNAIADQNGNDIDSTYYADWGFTSTGTLYTITPKDGNGNDLTSKALSLPAASTSAAGLITTGAQTLTGNKTFNSNSILTIQKAEGLNYSGIQNATGDGSRPVWFSHITTRGTPCYNSNFQYNPATKTLTVETLAGNATSADYVNNALTIGSKSFDGSAAVTITASDLGLGTALRFLGTTSSEMKDGMTQPDIVINGDVVTPIIGDTVLYKDDHQEYVWTGSWWEVLGDEGSFELRGVAQSIVDSLDYDDKGTGYVSLVMQEDGKIDVYHEDFIEPSVEFQNVGETDYVGLGAPRMRLTTTWGTGKYYELPLASGSDAGVLSIDDQEISGTKTFLDSIGVGNQILVGNSTNGLIINSGGGIYKTGSNVDININVEQQGYVTIGYDAQFIVNSIDNQIEAWSPVIVENNKDSNNSMWEYASLVTYGGITVEKQLSAKSVRVDNNQVDYGCTLTFDESANCVSFVFD